MSGMPSEDPGFDAEQIDEFAVGDSEPLPFRYVRQSRLIFPRGPLNKTWLIDQICAGNIRSTVLLPRGKNHGIRVVDLQSVFDLIEKLAQAPGPDPKTPCKGVIR
jgi:hypothetical protein